MTTTGLRYYDELGLVRPVARASGQRRYAEAAVAQVGVVLYLRDVGFSLAEIAALLRAPGAMAADWAELVERKLAELGEQEQRIGVARAALEHALRCPAGDPSRCPRFWSIIDARLSGLPLEETEAST